MLRLPLIAFTSLLALSSACAETPTADDHTTKAEARERLAACATEWQQMKRNGAEGGLIWREFSKACMARRARPAAARRAKP